MTVVLDASAVLALLAAEPGSDVVEAAAEQDDVVECAIRSICAGAGQRAATSRRPAPDARC